MPMDKKCCLLFLACIDGLTISTDHQYGKSGTYCLFVEISLHNDVVVRDRVDLHYPETFSIM